MNQDIRILSRHTVLPASIAEALQNEAILCTLEPAASIGEICDALLRGTADTALLPLHQVSLTLPEGVVITALTERERPAECLLSLPDSVVASGMFGLPQNPVIGLSGLRRSVQMKDLLPDYQEVELEGSFEEALHELRSGAVHALLWPEMDLPETGALQETGLNVLRFNPREFQPAPGQGVWAWLACRDDVAIRRLLKKLHHPAVAAATNVERGALRLLPETDRASAGIYTDCDAQGNYHVWASVAGTSALKRARLSSSTHFQLAEKVAAQFI
ncbi:MAG TPA: hydroxymethylbilane synthase [Saprospiraceae bacterium]|nr:hydroxymethylbilane synthase [Saprospiraceae bacterium]